MQVISIERQRRPQPVPALQTSLRAGGVTDPLEREADDLAEQMLRMPDPAPALTGRRPARAPTSVGAAPPGRGTTLVPAATAQAIAAQGGGRRLPEDLRASFGSRLPADLSGVRVHDDAAAATLARRVQARAFTVGRHVFFAAGEYQPGTASGQRLLGHELVHTVQQTPVSREHGTVKQGVRAPQPLLQRQPATLAVRTNTLLDIWADNVDVAQETFVASVATPAPPPEAALGRALLNIGLGAFTAGLLQPFSPATRGQAALLKVVEEVINGGLRATAEGLMDPAADVSAASREFARHWKKDQIEQVNSHRGRLIELLKSGQASDADHVALMEKVEKSVLSADHAAQRLLQLYLHALYYGRTGTAPAFESPGLVDLSINYGAKVEGNDPDVDKDMKPLRADVEVVGLDRTAIRRMNETLDTAGLDPVELGMPFAVTLWRMKVTGVAPGTDMERFEQERHVLYFDNGANLDKGDDFGRSVLKGWGNRVPVPAGFGLNKSIVGWAPVRA